METTARNVKRPNGTGVGHMELAMGTSIGGRFVVEAALGTGATGTVYLARHVTLETLVALKVLHPHLVENELAIGRFLEEARAIASLKGDNVTRVLDVGRTKDGIVFLALEYVVGRDLEEELKEVGRLPFGKAVRFALDVCSGLAEAHARGIVHRDLKPENLLIEKRYDGSSRIKLADFGVAKRLHQKQGRALTMDSSPVGTPSYMAPEQIQNSTTVDARADIFSLGVVLYEMLTGYAPFGGTTAVETYGATLYSDPTPPDELTLDLPPELSKIVLRCLAKRPEDRYQSVAELVEDLRPFSDGEAPSSATLKKKTEEEEAPSRLRFRRRSSSHGASVPVHRTLVSADVDGRRSRFWLPVATAAVVGLALAAPLGMDLDQASAVLHRTFTPRLAADSDAAPQRPAATVPSVGIPMLLPARTEPVRAEPVEVKDDASSPQGPVRIVGHGGRTRAQREDRWKYQAELRRARLEPAPVAQAPTGTLDLEDLPSEEGAGRKEDSARATALTDSGLGETTPPCPKIGDDDAPCASDSDTP